jgi:conjugative transfer signal peptidase TraF
MRTLRWTLALPGLACTLALLPWAMGVGILYNASASMPRGFWLMHPQSRDYRPGETVMACPDLAADQRIYLQAGFCPSGLEPVLKVIAAVAGDTVTVRDHQVEINGWTRLEYVQHEVDGSGRPLRAVPDGTYIVPTGEVWLLAPIGWSFDSRYFGSVKTNNLLGLMTPLWVWK